MTRERRQPTRAEWGRITSKRGAAVHRIPPAGKPQRPGPDNPDRGNHQDRGGGGPMPNSRCSGIKADGGACRGIPIHGSEWCVAHHPDYQEERRKGGRKGGRRGGRGRPMAEIVDLKGQLEDLAAGVLDGKVERGNAVVVNQILNTRARLIELERRIKETEELEARIERLEEGGALHEESA